MEQFVQHIQLSLAKVCLIAFTIASTWFNLFVPLLLFQIPVEIKYVINKQKIVLTVPLTALLLVVFYFYIFCLYYFFRYLFFLICTGLCGDNQCSGSETCANCVVDCSSCSKTNTLILLSVSFIFFLFFLFLFFFLFLVRNLISFLEAQKCVPTCTTNGACVAGACVCNPRFSGVDCGKGNRKAPITNKKYNVSIYIQTAIVQQFNATANVTGPIITVQAGNETVSLISTSSLSSSTTGSTSSMIPSFLIQVLGLKEYDIFFFFFFFFLFCFFVLIQCRCKRKHRTIHRFPHTSTTHWISTDYFAKLNLPNLRVFICFGKWCHCGCGFISVQ
jgi:hypothetical protein